MITHLLVVLLMIHLLDLDRNEAFVALLFGVFIDIDHIFGIPDFVSKNGILNITNKEMLLSSPIQWKSAFHNPMAILVVAPSSASFRFAIPLFAWGIHIAMDAIQVECLGVASLVEILFMLMLLGILFVMEIRNFQITQVEKKASISGFFSWELEKMSSFFSQSLFAKTRGVERSKVDVNHQSPP